MIDNFLRCLPITLAFEGGFSNNPHDPGGVTDLGVTKRQWEAWVGHPVTVEDMKALTPAGVMPFYRTWYWQAASCDSLPLALALCVFDFAVNSGPGRAAMELQKVVGASPDGHIGPNTLRAILSYTVAHSVLNLIEDYQDARKAFVSKMYFSAALESRCDRVLIRANLFARGKS